MFGRAAISTLLMPAACFLMTDTTMAQEPVLDRALRAHPGLQQVLDNAEKYRLQVVLGLIEVGPEGTPVLRQETFRSGAEYFYPASTVKLFAAVAAAQKIATLRQMTGYPIDLDTPSNSRLVQRLIELHNCWDDCPSNAAEMEAAITAMADSIDPTPVDPALLVSRALSLPEGIVASGGSRHENDLIALYEFKTGQGSVAYDTSGVDPAINLTLSGGYSWVEGWGIQFGGAIYA